MKRLPRKRIYRIYNPIDDSKVNEDSMNPVLIETGLKTYDTFYRQPLASADKYIVDDGIEYNEFRLENSACIPTSGIWSDQYYYGELYRLQNPEFSADYPSVSSELYPVPNRPILVNRMKELYLRKPVYKQNFFDTSALQPLSSTKEEELDPLEEFEIEYRAFITMLKNKKR